MVKQIAHCAFLPCGEPEIFGYALLPPSWKLKFYRSMVAVKNVLLFMIYHRDV